MEVRVLARGNGIDGHGGSPRHETQGQNPGSRRRRAADQASRLCGAIHQPRRIHMAVTTETSPATKLIRPFTVEFTQAAVEDLRARIAATRFPEREPIEEPVVHPLGNAVPPQGVELATMEALMRYWGTEYDLRKAESAAQRAAAVRDRDRRSRRSLHPCEVPPRECAAGDPDPRLAWLGCGDAERVGPLTDPTAHGGSVEDAFDVVIPSIPGYGLLGEADSQRLGSRHVASAATANEAPGLQPLCRTGW